MAWKTSAPLQSPTRSRRGLSLGFRPYGMGDTKPNHTKESEHRDPLTGAGRDAWFLAASDIDELGLHDGDEVLVRSEHGHVRAHLHASPVRPGNMQVFFPEGNVLLRAGRRDPGVPDDNTVVTVEAARR